MPASVDVRLREARDPLERTCVARVIRLARHVVDIALQREAVHDPRREIPLQAAGQPDIDLESRVREGPVADAAAARPPCQVQRVLLGRGLNPGTVAAEAGDGIKDFRLEDGRAVFVCRCVERPVPVTLNSVSCRHS